MMIFDPARIGLTASWLIPMSKVPEVAIEQAEKFALVPSQNPDSRDRYRPYRHHDANALVAAVLQALEYASVHRGMRMPGSENSNGRRFTGQRATREPSSRSRWMANDLTPAPLLSDCRCLTPEAQPWTGQRDRASRLHCPDPGAPRD